MTITNQLCLITRNYRRSDIESSTNTESSTVASIAVSIGATALVFASMFMSVAHASVKQDVAVPVSVFEQSINTDKVLSTSESAHSSSTEQNILFIPGLMSDASVWGEVSAGLVSKHRRFHYAEIAGFAGQPMFKGNNVALVKEYLVRYIIDNELDNVVVIGHSMGALLSYELALALPDNISNVVAVDGLPFIMPIFTRTNATTADEAKPFAARIQQQYAAMSPQQLAQFSRQGISIQATGEANQARVMSMIEQSHPGTVGQMMADVMVTDLRVSLKANKVPILLLGASGGFSTKEDHAWVEQLYRGQFVGNDSTTIIMNTQSRHFMMFDDSAWVLAQINNFLNEKG